MIEQPIFTPVEAEEILRGRRNRNLETLVADTIAAHPKRRGELRAEYTRRILRIVREHK